MTTEGRLPTTVRTLSRIRCIERRDSHASHIATPGRFGIRCFRKVTPRKSNPVHAETSFVFSSLTRSFNRPRNFRSSIMYRSALPFEEPAWANFIAAMQPPADMA